MDQQERKDRPKLESSEALKGGKVNKKHGVSRLIVLAVLVVCVGVLAGLYYGTDLFKTPVDESAADVVAEETPNPRVQLLERTTADFSSMTVTQRDGETFTIVSNIQYDADGNVIADEAEPATQGDAVDPEPTPEPVVEPEQDSDTAVAVIGGADGSTQVFVTDGIIREAPVKQDYALDGMPYFALNGGVASSLVNYAVAITSQETVAQDSANLAEFGLVTPSIVVDVTYRDGTTAQLRFGDAAPTGTYTYMQVNDDQKVYMVYTSVYNSFARTIASMHVTPTVTPVAGDAVRHMVIEQKDMDTIELAFEDAEKDSFSINTLVLLQPINYNANSERVQEIFNAEAALAISGYAGHVSTDAELAQFGLLEPKARIFAEGETTDDEGNTTATSFEIWIGDTADGVAYARIDDTGDVYTVSTSLLSFLGNARLMYLVDQFTNLVNIAKIDSLTVNAKDTSYFLNIERTPVTDADGKEDTQELYYFDKTLTTEDLFKDFYQILVGTLSDKACPDHDYQGEVVCSVTYDVNIEGMDDFTVEYLDYDKDYYAVRRDGHTYFLIRRVSIDAMLDACVQYRAGEFVGNP